MRLTNPKNYNSTHKHRFSRDGVGLGLEGRRDDTTMNVLVAGQAQITRDTDPEMDTPHKPQLPWDSPTKTGSPSRPKSRDSRRGSKTSSSSPPPGSVFDRLSKPTKKRVRGRGE